MNTTFTKWGNSLAVRIPKDLVVDLNLRPGIPINFEKMDGKLVISPKKYDFKLIPLEKLLKGMKKQKLLWPNDAPRGKEVW